jgi:hypothetical protein
MNNEEINEGGGWKPKSIDSNFELLNRIENLENKLNSPLYKSAPAMLEALGRADAIVYEIDTLIAKGHMNSRSKLADLRLKYGDPDKYEYTILLDDKIKEQATGKTINEVLCNHKRS